MVRQFLSPVVIFLLIVAFLAGGVFLFLHYFDRAPELPESPPAPLTTPHPPPPPPEPTAPAAELPPLDESDDFTRRLVEGLTSHPQLTAWLVPEDQVRRFVAAIDNVARGEDPRPHLRFLDPGRGFEVAFEDDGMVIDERSYQRYDLVTEVFTSLDTDGSVRLYRDLHPLFDEAYRELGYPAGSFDQVMRRAIQRILAAPVPAAAVEVEPRLEGYRFKSPGFENLGPVEKQLLRMGPANVRKIQSKLRLIQTALTLTRPDSPP
ncbi:MAG: DUF3014 domain-containing protein [bacterium]|nr:DUF3014 domain-containing protein [bacterium]